MSPGEESDILEPRHDTAKYWSILYVTQPQPYDNALFTNTPAASLSLARCGHNFIAQEIACRKPTSIREGPKNNAVDRVC